MKHTGYFTSESGTLAEFAELTARVLDPSELSFTDRVEKNVPIYDMAALGQVLAGPKRSELLAEWAWVLGKSAGAVVLKQAQPDHAAIDAATDVFNRIVADEAGQGGGADHFAAAGANSRIWNALEKHCKRDPAGFAAYYGAPAVAAVAEAWLGPDFQMTAQVNVVRPGGQAQTAHRDYHLGFQTADVAAKYPAHVHDLSQVMTLQGALAHCDMPLTSGPTKLLPFSQMFAAGYMAYRRPEFAEHFEAHCIQLPLEKGDGLFFNPALFHAAGANVSEDIHRMANLLQVSSAFGRAMETVDRVGMSKLIFDVMGDLPEERREAAIACTAEGYAFPTNLDTDPPVGGLAPESMAALLRRGLAEGMSAEAFGAALDAQITRRGI
ncbi:phytanoyl-CoA dioxygenase family protein [Gymnodinialimonas hymeniacidonis]|uniref:phytanoyl-CoA dioxygenase family protein n=1 Tax=Gymnodinialimonas hymeniacidonis TaxID=3126508 RepID=UPI0034C69A6C